jgi:hypothetical protein
MQHPTIAGLRQTHDSTGFRGLPNGFVRTVVRRALGNWSPLVGTGFIVFPPNAFFALAGELGLPTDRLFQFADSVCLANFRGLPRGFLGGISREVSDSRSVCLKASQSPI